MVRLLQYIAHSRLTSVCCHSSQIASFVSSVRLDWSNKSSQRTLLIKGEACPKAVTPKGVDAITSAATVSSFLTRCGREHILLQPTLVGLHVKILSSSSNLLRKQGHLQLYLPSRAASRHKPGLPLTGRACTGSSDMSHWISLCSLQLRTLGSTSRTQSANNTSGLPNDDSKCRATRAVPHQLRIAHRQGTPSSFSDDTTKRVHASTSRQLNTRQWRWSFVERSISSFQATLPPVLSHRP